MQSGAPSSATDEHLPVGYKVPDELFEAYARKRGICKSPQTDIFEKAMSDLQNQITPLGPEMENRIEPSWNTSIIGDAIYLQVSGWKGCDRGADWRADEKVERAYCEALGLKFKEGRESFTPLGYWED